MLGFGGWPLSSGQDLLLHEEQEVFGVLAPLPLEPEFEESVSEAVPDEPRPPAAECSSWLKW